MLMTTPDWLDRQEYPFRSRYLELDGCRMRYIDEGHGQTIVMIHGNPDWSFTYRHLIKRLSGQFRCIAVDHIGFGLSDKPTTKAPLPSDHARNLCVLIDRLDLGGITLVVNDWGGPIALPFAVAHPDRSPSLPGVGHYPHEEQPEEVASALESFMHETKEEIGVSPRIV